MLREYLATSKLDLLNLYNEFKATPAGQEFNRFEFLRLPILTVYEVVRLSTERDKRFANINSITTSRMVGVILSIAQSFSNKKNKPIDLVQFLPFPMDESQSAVAVQTQQVYKKLVAQRKLPLAVVAGLSKIINT